MAGNRTFTMIKPGAFQEHLTGPIISRIEEAGYRLVAMKLAHLTKEQAAAFYAEHTGKPFFEGLTEKMSAGRVVAMVLEKENAVDDFRKLIGATDPAKADEGTIRKLFGRSVTDNAIHGSDSDETAKREEMFFFSALEEI